MKPNSWVTSPSVYLGGISQGMTTSLGHYSMPPVASMIHWVAFWVLHYALREVSYADENNTSIISTPCFFRHGKEDIWVPVELGRQEARILQCSMEVEWNEFGGVDKDGHWIKRPEGFDQVLRFLQRQSTRDPGG
ncbi:uncharacterized protein ATNIH1004_006732 [Aspergillus tanneri]|uniref:Uncharacterized protein n=1 Tax=Aspergillus tanneri TaxID=1220188 RepID=A0A5M9MK10_9EURO|nr:uncharacterized protein ATNIH1004_006732 [Aspergillus tanneri]KAA8645313.1 hypothetical protein ATNIH1004_006732 [Aspergillus tanneri]